MNTPESLSNSRGSVFAATAWLSLCWTGTCAWSQKTDSPPADPAVEETAEAPKKAVPPQQKQVIVSGQILLPDGSPAQDIVVMTATDKYGWGEGFTNGNYTKTDEKGRYRIISKRWLPQRLFWLPDEYENNSCAVTAGGEQKPVRLKPARKIRGLVTDFAGNAVPNIWVRADGASRTPITWAKTNDKGEFQFRPLPADEYHLMPVRSYHDHLTGQLKFYKLKIPFNSIKYDLPDDGELALAKIVAPETVSIRVHVVDAGGQPVTGEYVSIGDIGDYPNALIADEVKDQPGTYEFQFPKGKYIRDLKLRHSWDEIAYYQETPAAEALPAEAIVLSKADQNIDGIKITVRPAAKLLVQLKQPNGDAFDDGTYRMSVAVDHPESLSPSDRATVALQPAHFGSAKQPGLHEFRGVIPECDVKVTVRGDEINTVTKTVRLSEGETRTIDVVVKEKTTAILRGKIVDENGKPVETKGWLYSRGTIDNGNPNATHSYHSTEAHVAQSFGVEVPRGSVVLSLFTPGYAPAWIGPLTVKAREKRDDLKFVLQKGITFPIQVRDTAGNPVAGATIISHPEIDGDTGGPNFELVADQAGNYRYQHAADTRYVFNVTAPGYEQLRTERLEIAAGKPIKLTLQPSPITRGVIDKANGAPAANAKIMLVATVTKDDRTFLNGGDYGKLLGTADEQGQFELNSLSKGSKYLIVVEAEDKARVLAYDFVAGQQDLKIEIPKRKDLRIRVIGDTNLLHHRRNKPFVSVRQHIASTQENPNSRTVIGDDVFVTKTKEGGLALYQGLVSGTVRVGAAGQGQTVDVNEGGVTEVVIRLAEPDAAKAQAAEQE